MVSMRQKVSHQQKVASKPVAMRVPLVKSGNGQTRHLLAPSALVGSGKEVHRASHRRDGLVMPVSRLQHHHLLLLLLLVL
jgi:hypothetical protein